MVWEICAASADGPRTACQEACARSDQASLARRNRGTASFPRRNHSHWRRRRSSDCSNRNRQQRYTTRFDRRCPVRVRQQEDRPRHLHGRVIPLANGSESPSATATRRAKMTLKTESCDGQDDLPISFTNHIVPIFRSSAATAAAATANQAAKTASLSPCSASCRNSTTRPWSRKIAAVVSSGRSRRRAACSSQGGRPHGPRRRQANGGRFR